MSRSSDRVDPADGAIAIPWDVDLTEPVVALNVRESGVLNFIGADGRASDVYIIAGVAFPLRIQRAVQAGSTVTGLRGLC